jgi:hypothetical protein
MYYYEHILIDLTLHTRFDLNETIISGKEWLIIWFNKSSSLSSLHGLGESPVTASSIVVSLSIFFLVYLYLVFRTVDIYIRLNFKTYVLHCLK